MVVDVGFNTSVVDDKQITQIWSSPATDDEP